MEDEREGEREREKVGQEREMEGKQTESLQDDVWEGCNIAVGPLVRTSLSYRFRGREGNPAICRKKTWM